MEDARAGFDDLARTVENALYLDEDAYNQALPIHQYTAKIQVGCLIPHLWRAGCCLDGIGSSLQPAGTAT